MKITSDDETLAENKVLILYILEQAGKALTNDVLYKIDGKDIQGLSIFDITSMIKNGSIDEEVKITVLRNGTEKEFILKRENIEIESVFVNYYENGDNKIAIISISKFAKNSFFQF